ncbi:MAG: hypothetical protein AB7F41_11035 [Methylocystis sp.]
MAAAMAGKIRTTNGIIAISKIFGARACGSPVNFIYPGFFQNPFDSALPVEDSLDFFPLAGRKRIPMSAYPRCSAYARGLWT